MRYVLLIYANEGSLAGRSEAEEKAVMEGYNAFTREVQERRVFRGGEPFESVAVARTVRVRNSERLVSDGPFAETMEQLGGFYILNCNDMDEAIGLAAKLPTAQYGSIEVRPILEMPD